MIIKRGEGRKIVLNLIRREIKEKGLLKI